MEINTLIHDVEILHKTADQDFHAKRYESYQDYLNQFNQYLGAAKEFGVNDIQFIKNVPDGDKGAYGMIGSQPEIAKHREIINSSSRLLQRLSQGIIVKRDDIEVVMNIFKKFHTVASQLTRRYSSRDTLKINDEYDVQDLLYALLKLHFDDIRPEEYTPSYAGSSSRMDFLLKSEKIVIEVKKTRQTLTQKEIGEQLIIDISKYSAHQDCKTLMCFVYDPDLIIHNPHGVESDLNNKSTENMKVITYIAPK